MLKMDDFLEKNRVIYRMFQFWEISILIGSQYLEQLEPQDYLDQLES